MIERDVAPQHSVDAIRAHGDPLDADSRMRKGLGVRTFAPGQALALLPPTSHGWLGAEYFLTYPVYSAGMTAVAGLVYGARRMTAHRSMVTSQEHETVVRDELAEPVDIIRTGKRKNRELLIRWYGADKVEDEADKPALVQRLLNVIDFAEEHSIERVAVGTSWLEGMISPGELETHGDVKPGESLVSDSKKQKVKVKDTTADTNILVATPTQLSELLSSIEIDNQDSTIAWLVGSIGDPLISERYAIWQASPHNKGRFRSFVANELEQAYNEHDISGKVRPHDAYGRRTGLAKSRGNSTVSDTYVHQSQFYSGPNTSGATSQFEGSQHVLASVYAKNLEQLLERLSQEGQQGQPDKKGLLAALYLTLLQGDASHPDSHVRTTGAAVRGDMTVSDTLLQRMVSERLVTFPKTRSHRNRPEARTLQYRQRHNVLRRGIASIAMLSLYGGLGFGVSKGGYELFSAAYQKEEVDYNQYVDTQKAQHAPESSIEDFDTWLSQQNDPVGLYVRSWNDLTGKDFDFSVYMAKRYIQLLGTTNLQELGQYADVVSQQWLQKAIDTLPPGAYTGNFNMDLLSNTTSTTLRHNQTLYNVTSLHGASTKGYWYAGSLDSMYLTPGLPPFQDQALALNSSTDNGQPHNVDLPAKPVPTADYLVETPYLSTKSALGVDIGTHIPMIQGGKIVAARVVDAHDHKLSTTARLEVVPKTGLYSFRPFSEDLQHMQDIGINKPVLQYWVKKTPDVTVHTSGHFLFPDERQTGKQVDVHAIAAEVKEALGLTAGASNSAVLKAIRDGKYYSYTPFKDDGITNVKIQMVDGKQPNDTQIIEQLGTLMAHMHDMFCNEAAITYALATGGNGPDDLNVMSGYRDNGDGKLTQLETHMWDQDSKGHIFDATPRKSRHPISVKPAPETTPNGSNGKLPLGLAGESLLAAALMVLAYKRRNQIVAGADQARSQVAISRDDASLAITAINLALHGQNHKLDAVGTKLTPNQISRMSILQPAYPPLKGKDVVQVLGDRANRETAKAVKRLLRHQAAIQRTNKRTQKR